MIQQTSVNLADDAWERVGVPLNQPDRKLFSELEAHTHPYPNLTSAGSSSSASLSCTDPEHVKWSQSTAYRYASPVGRREEISRHTGSQISFQPIVKEGAGAADSAQCMNSAHETFRRIRDTELNAVRWNLLRT